MNISRLTFALLAAAGGLQPMSAQTEQTDTLAIIKAPHSILITKGEGSAGIEVRGTKDNEDFFYGYNVETDSVVTDNAKAADSPEEWNIDFPFSSKDKRKAQSSLRVLKNIYCGAFIPVASADGLKTSWEGGIGEIVGYGWRQSPRAPIFSAGFGFGFSELKCSKGYMFAKQGQALSITRASEGDRDVSAVFRLWSLRFPFMMTYEFGNSPDTRFGFSLGVVLNLNVNATAFSQTWHGDVRYKQFFDGLHQRIMTADILAVIGGVDAIGVYVRYSPMRLMKKNFGPDMSVISVGGSINF